MSDDYDELSAALASYWKGRRCAMFLVWAMALGAIYVVKSLLGINLIDGFSLGIF